MRRALSSTGFTGQLAPRNRGQRQGTRRAGPGCGPPIHSLHTGQTAAGTIAPVVEPVPVRVGRAVLLWGGSRTGVRACRRLLGGDVWSLGAARRSHASSFVSLRVGTASHQDYPAFTPMVACILHALGSPVPTPSLPSRWACRSRPFAEPGIELTDSGHGSRMKQSGTFRERRASPESPPSCFEQVDVPQQSVWSPHPLRTDYADYSIAFLDTPIVAAGYRRAE